MTASGSPEQPHPSPVQARITSYWDLHAESYDRHPNQIITQPIKDAWANVWYSALPTPPADILDVGTGAGHVALLLAELGYHVTGIDLSESMLNLARAKTGTMANIPTLQVGDAVTPPFPPASFDAVTNRKLLWTLREPHLALSHWRQLLRPGGVLAAVDGVYGAMRRDGDSADAARRAFRRFYDERVASSLPLGQAVAIEEAAAAVREAGFIDVRVTRLTEIERRCRALVVDSTDVYPQFLITARSC